jgi:hypothetical protein
MFMDDLINSNYATCWTIRLPSNACDSGDSTVAAVNEYVKKMGIIQQYGRPGDLVENTVESGYRSNGVYMLQQQDDSIGIIPLDYSYDDYGGPSHKFSVITDFPLDYWFYSKMNTIFLGGNSQSYWHCTDEYQYLYFNGDRLREMAMDIIEDTDANQIRFKCNEQEYTIDYTCSFSSFCKKEVVLGRTAREGHVQY